MRAFLTPRWLLSHLFVVVMVVVMANLGFWQLGRLDERKDRNDEVRAALEAEPGDLAGLLDAGTIPTDHRAVTVRGRYLDDRSFLVANRTYDTQAGSWLATPLELADGTVVVVSRGWVPRLWAAGEDPRDLSAPDGDVVVVGRAFASTGGGSIGGGDVSVLPEVSRLDLDRVEELLGADVAPVWVQLDDQVPPLGDLPVPVPRAGLDEGPHLSYAFQWFFFSVATMIAYGLILRRRAADPRPDSQPDPRTDPQPDDTAAAADALVLLAVRLRSRGSAGAVRATWIDLGGDPAVDIDAALQRSARLGHVRSRGDEPRWSLTPTGREELDEQLAHSTDLAGRAPLTSAYEDFLALNRDFLAACVGWTGEPGQLDGFAELVDRLDPVLDTLDERLDRFGAYPRRFRSALERARTDPSWLDGASVDSVHTIWFELHEHLLATLGRDRTQER